MANIVSFSRTPEQFLKYGERGLIKQITAGRMTEEDATLIRQFVDAMRVQNGAGEARAYKMTNSLSNVCRFIKTPLMENTIADINAAVLKIKNGRKIKNCLVMAPLPENLKPDADTEVFEFTRDGQQWYHVCKTTGPLSQDTKRDYITFLKRFYIWCVEEGYCNLPIEKLRKIKTPATNRATKTAEQMLTKDEVMRMINACNGESGIRDRAMLALLYEGGLRVNELAALQWSDLKFEGPFIKINVCSKTGIPRYIPLTASKEYVSTWRDAYPDGEPEGDRPVFVTTLKTLIDENGRRVRQDTYKSLTYKYTLKHIQQIAARAKIEKKVTCHLFRHSRVTALLRDGFPESVIKMMCWGSLSSDMLSNYGHLANSDTDRAVARAAGIEIVGAAEEEDKFKNKICPRCHSPNSPTSGFCHVCGEPLTKEAAVSLEEAKREIHEDDRYRAIIERLQKIEELTAAVTGPGL